MPKKYIFPKDISIPDEKRGNIKLFDKGSYYSRSQNSYGPVILYSVDEVVWPLNGEMTGEYSGWEDDAKKAIVKHNNKDITLLEKTKFHVNLFLSSVPNKLASAIFLLSAIMSTIALFISC